MSMVKNMKKRRIKKDAVIKLSIIILVIVLMFAGIKMFKHYTSYEYKLGKVGYSDDEISTLLKLDKKYSDYALKGYDKDLVPLAEQKYFIWKNYKDYVSYIKNTYKNEKIDYKNTVTKVNTKTNYDAYTHTSVTNMDKGYAILVNKYYSLPENYAPDDITEMSNQYAYPNNSIKAEVYEAFKEMSKKAKESNITLIVNSSYRPYEDQKEIYDDYADNNGKEYADKYAARPSFSEHQTGLALDIFTPGAGMKNFENTDAFKWLADNSYKYGFILRYPKDKEDITKYAYESWHYRYLGKDLATKVYKSGLTFDEYYAYYLDK